MPQKAHSPELSATPPPETTISAIGTFSELVEGKVLLPDFVVHNEGGVQVNLGIMEGPVQMQRFVDRVVAAGAFFAGLDYAAFSQLLYSDVATTSPGARADRPMVRIADDIASFAPKRRELYKNIKSVNNGARIEYAFGPTRLERVVEVPIYGETDEAGQPVLTGYDKQVYFEPTKLNSDEFVAAMWSNNIRCGIDIAAVQAAIESGRDQRIDIARQIDPVAGADATVQERTEALHRDDTPAILANGKVDLSQYKNHFPQVSAGTNLLQKQPRRLGVPGIDTSGKVLEPGIPRDFDLEDLAGVGTRIERTAKGEFLVAARDGFLNIDTKSHQISITEKIVNRNGVSLRTTGNLLLVGEHYDEHGEVQEHRTVEGKHMNFFSDVFGSIVSNGGQVHLHGNLAGGSVRNSGGLVQIDGRASRALLEVREGEVQARYAESSTIVAGKVTLGRAVACDIVAEDVEIDEAVGCTIAARRIRVARAGSRREAETLLTVCIPDFAVLDKSRTSVVKEIDKLKRRITAKQTILDARMAVAEVKNYLAAEQGIRAGAVKLTLIQDGQWRQATQKLAGTLFEIQTLQKEIEALSASLGDQNEQLAVLDTQREQAGADIRCEVGRVVGDVAVQMISIASESPVFAETEASKVKRKLRDTRAARQRLFHGESGSFSWTWKPRPTAQ